MRTHPFRWSALVFGLVFAAISIGTVLPVVPYLPDLLPRLTLLAPVALIGLGVLGLIASLVFAARKKPAATVPVQPPVSTVVDGPTEKTTVLVPEDDSPNGEDND